MPRSSAWSLASHSSRCPASSARSSTLTPSTPGTPPLAITCRSAASRTSFRHTSPYRLHAFHFGLLFACRYSVLCNFRIAPFKLINAKCEGLSRGLDSRCRFRHRGCCYPLRAITPFSFCVGRVSTTAPPLLRARYRRFIAHMEGSDSSQRRCGLPHIGEVAPLVGACAPRWEVSRVTLVALPDMPSPPTPPER